MLKTTPRRANSRLHSMHGFMEQFPENGCHWRRYLKGHIHRPSTQGLRENFGLLFSRRHLFPNKRLSASYFRSTCIFIQPTLCAGDCLWALRFHQCLFQAEWKKKIAQDENIEYVQPRMWDAPSCYRADIWFLPLWKCHLAWQSSLCLSLIAASCFSVVHEMMVCLNKL